MFYINLIEKTMKNIQMVDLQGQMQRIRSEVDEEISKVIDECKYIGGKVVSLFEQSLSTYQRCKHTISCASGTDALQIAIMALELESEDEVIVPAFTYAAVIEVVLLLGLKPVLVDVDEDTYNISVEAVRRAITDRTKAIIPVHLFGHMADMQGIMTLADKHGIWIIEDNAQSIGSISTWNGRRSGTLGHIGCTSFFPTKNLGCLGDGGAINTNDTALRKKMRMVANHGQQQRYIHDCIGVNSRLDAIQAAVLTVQLKQLDTYISQRKNAAAFYDQHLAALKELILPRGNVYSDHVYHQYTIRVVDGRRDGLRAYLQDRGIPSSVYYPLPAHHQKAYANHVRHANLDTSTRLCEEVLSLPMHTELEEGQLDYICSQIHSFYSNG